MLQIRKPREYVFHVQPKSAERFPASRGADHPDHIDLGTGGWRTQPPTTRTHHRTLSPDGPYASKLSPEPELILSRPGP